MSDTVADTKYWHRVYRIEIGPKESPDYVYDSKEIEDSGETPFDIKFDVDVKLTITPKFSVDILGLSKSTIEALTIWDVTQAFADQRPFRLYAGYAGTDGQKKAELIAAGIILSAIPVGPPPEIWMHFECMTNGESIIPEYNPDYSAPDGGSDSAGDPGESSSKSINVESDDVGETVGENTKREINAAANAINAEKVKDLRAEKQDGEGHVADDCPGSTAAQMAENASKKSRLRISVRTDPTGETDRITVVVDNENWEKREDEAKEELSIETGLLSITVVNFLQATATRLLDTGLQILDICKVDSVYLNSYDGNFLVLGVRHTGHFRGNEWFTQLSLLKSRDAGQS